MWSSLDCFLCCKKLITKQSHEKEKPTQSLINKIATNKQNDTTKGRTEHYQVRRVSRVAGTISMEDVTEGLKKPSGGSDNNINYKTTKEPKISINNKEINDSGLWECPSEESINSRKSTDIVKKPINKSTENVKKSPSSKPATTTEDKSPRSWHKALQVKSHHIGQRLHHKSSVSPTNSLAVSTPDLSLLGGDLTKEVKTQQMGRTSPTAWSKSQSLLDVSAKDKSQSLLDVSAKDYGLDLTLYASEPDSPRDVPDLHEPVSAGNTLPKRDEAFAEMSHGTLNFAAGFQPGKLHVHVSHIDDLPAKGEGRKYAVTLKLAVLVQDGGKAPPGKASKTARDATNPCRFKEDFEFALDAVEGCTLRISVCDASAHGKYEAVGHTLFALEDANLQSQPRSYKRRLYNQSEPSNGNEGVLQATLSYDQREQRISLLAIQCRGLRLGRGTKAPDKYTTYAKVSLYCKGQKIKSKRSSAINHERDPFYNHMFQFRVGSDTLADSCLIISVMLKGRLKMDTLIGRTILGPNFYADGTSMTPWGRVVLGQQTASHWYRLYI